jgi:hypothetical protein
MKELMLWLENSFTLPPCDEISQVQGLICGCLNNITDRLGTNILCNQPQIVDSLFQLYTRVIETTLASAANELPSVALNSEGRATTERFGRTEERSKGGSEEDAILAIGTLLRGKHNGVYQINFFFRFKYPEYLSNGIFRLFHNY